MKTFEGKLPLHKSPYLLSIKTSREESDMGKPHAPASTRTKKKNIIMLPVNDKLITGLRYSLGENLRTEVETNLRVLVWHKVEDPLWAQVYWHRVREIRSHIARKIEKSK